MMTAAEILIENGYEDIIVFENDSYDEALIGVTTDNRAVYSYEKMVKYLMDRNNISRESAIDWIEYNTIRALPYIGDRAPVIVRELYII